MAAKRSAPAVTEQVVSVLQTEDPKWPHLSGNAGLGAMQLRFCWACKEGALGIGNGTMMQQLFLSRMGCVRF